MDTSRLIINTIDKSSYNVEEETSLVGFTVVKAPKGPTYPVRIPAGGASKLQDIFGVSSKDYPELFEVETFNKEYDIFVSAPYDEEHTKVNVAYITGDGIFTGLNPVSYDRELESVILGLEDDLSVDVASKFGITEGSSVNVLKDYRFSKSNNFLKAESDLGSSVIPSYEINFSDESVLLIPTGIKYENIMDETFDFKIIGLKSTIIPTFKVENGIIKEGNVTVGSIVVPNYNEDGSYNPSSPSSGDVVSLEIKGASGTGIIDQEYIKNFLNDDSERSSLEIYYLASIPSDDIYGVISPKYASERNLHISFEGFNDLIDYRYNNPEDRNLLKMTVYEDGAFRDASHKISVTGSLKSSDVDSNGVSIGFVESNSSYYIQDLIYVYTVKEFNKDSDININILKYPSILIHGGERYFDYINDIRLHNLGWEIAKNAEFSDVDIFFDCFDYSKDVTGLKDSIFFSLVTKNSDGHNLSGYIFNYTVDPSTVDNFNKTNNYLSFGRNYWNICNLAVMSLNDGSRFFSTMTGARSLMQCRIIDNRWGGVAPMWENEGTPGLGGQLDMINPVRLKYRYTKDQLDTLDKFNYNPVINDRQYGIMVVGHKTCKPGKISDWSYIGHACAFFNFLREIRNNVMIPQIGKANNPYYRDLRNKQVSQYLRERLEGDNRIWAWGSVDTSTADGVNDEYARKALKFVINVSVRVDIFSESVELNFTNEDQSSFVSFSDSSDEV